ncbi:MAG: sigma 54-interacting transcriptional regulator, partial [Deltaproteobacteria bacterium]|nr:sigma 54-interacting transcriptional regulator [Deltaproteobacteria bacterium]
MDFEIDGVFKPFLDGLFLGVLMVDKSGRIVYANQRLLEMDELTPEDTLGYRISEVYSLREEDSPTMKALSTGQPVSEFMTYKTARGKQFSTMNNSYPLYRGDELVGVITLATDVTSLLASALPRGSHLAGQKPAPEPEDEDGIVKFDSLIGKSPLFREAIDVAKVAAAGPSPVMLIGETGVGKDLFAKAIHDFGARAGKKFMAVNCSAIPEALLEGILFGTAKGAFTGATDRVGLLEHASGGTLFLDEINSMPMV